MKIKREEEEGKGEGRQSEKKRRRGSDVGFIKEGKWEMKEEVRKMSGIKREKNWGESEKKKGRHTSNDEKEKRGHKIKGCTDEGKRRSR